MANSRFYSSTALETTLTNSVTPSTTIIQVAATTGFPGSLPYTIALDYGSASMELVDVTGVAGLNLTVTRAIDGTSAASHNAGAAVRHVSSARDFTDSRTHEQDNSAVHGVTGDLVGTTDTQTLTNKTIAGAALSGTFSGNPDFTGSVDLNGGGNLAGTFTGTATFSDGITITGSPTITNSPTGALTGVWTGNRTFNGTSTFGGTIQSTRTASTDIALAAGVTADTFDRFRILESGSHEWGSGAAARDTNLFRSAADTLRTDDSLSVGGTLAVTGTSTLTGNTTVTGNLTVGGVGQFQSVYKTTDTSRANTATVANDPHLTVPVVANGVYLVDAWLKYFAHPTPDFKMTFGTPAGTLGEWSGLGRGLSSAAETASVNGYLIRTDSNDINQERNFYGVTDADLTVHVKGMVRVAGTAGNLVIQWSQGTSDATATVLYADSWMRVHRIA